MRSSRRQIVTPIKEQAFSLSEALGVSRALARRDHTHGTPADTATDKVVGPASAVNLSVAVYDGITGRRIADGGKTIQAIIDAARVGYVADAPSDGKFYVRRNGTWEELVIG